MSARPRRIQRFIGLPLMCLAMFSVLGGHWAVLQTVAWVQMLRDYTRAEGSIVAGAEKTFGGQHPCALCKKVEQGRQNEEKAPATVKVDKKAESFLCAATTAIPFLLGQDVSYPSLERFFFAGRADAPPFPPPKSNLI